MSSTLPAWSAPSGSKFQFSDYGMFIVRRWRLAIVLFGMLVLSMIALHPANQKAVPEVWSRYKPNAFRKGDRSGDVFNTTLGFQKVYAIGMKGRTDKSDAMEQAAAIIDIDVTWQDGVASSDVPAKAYPETWEISDNGALGSWRAHMNVLARIVKERVQTALILEDDTDWDVSLKEQLSVYADGVRRLQGDDASVSPYGNHWDVHWVGHCRSGPSGRNQPVYVIKNDPTVPPIPRRHGMWRHTTLPDFILSNSTRVVYDCHKAMCTFGYAVTFNGARKILASLADPAEFRIYDIAMNFMCSQDYLAPFKCYSIYPPLMSSHRFAGRVNRDSDLQYKSKNITHAEYSWDVVYSTMMNTKSIITGSDHAVSQWSKDMLNNTWPLNGSYVNHVTTEMRNMVWKQETVQSIVGINSLPQNPGLPDE